MIRLQPIGSKLLVLPITNEENSKTEGGLEMVELEFSRGTIVEVGTGVTDVFKKGDVVIFPKQRGTTKMYQGQQHLWIDGQPVSSGGDVWAIEIEDKPVIDKGENLSKK